MNEKRNDGEGDGKSTKSAWGVSNGTGAGEGTPGNNTSGIFEGGAVILLEEPGSAGRRMGSSLGAAGVGFSLRFTLAAST